jgi:hypothetical protein
VSIATGTSKWWRAGSSLEPAIAKLDKYQLLILDDNVTKDQAETSVLKPCVAGVGARLSRAGSPANNRTG